MAYITHTLNVKLATQYKGYYYQKSNDEYIIFDSKGNKRGVKFSIKSCKELINKILEG